MQSTKIKDFFYSIVSEYPKQFTLLFVLLLLEAFVSIISIAAIAPLADYMLDPKLDNPNKITVLIMDLINKEKSEVGFWFFAAVFGVTNLSKAVFEIFLRYAILNIKYNVYRGLTIYSLELFFSAKWEFFSKNKSGDFLNSFNKELNKVGETIGHFATQVALLVQISVYLLFPIWLNPTMTLSALTISFFLLLPIFLFRQMSYRLGKANTETANTLMSSISETFNSIKLTIAFDAAKFVITRITDSLDAHEKATIRSQTFLAGVGLFAQPLAIIGGLAATGIAITQGTTITEIAVVLWSLLRIMPVLSRLLQTNMNITNFIPSYEQIRALQSQAQSAKEPTGKTWSGHLQKSIDFKNVTFGYENRVETLSKASFSIPALQTTALVGASGSGKSTIIDLTMGLLYPLSGSVEFDGHNLTNINKQALRNSIGLVPQDAFLFDSTIRANLLWANRLATEQDLMSALQKANATEFVDNLPNGIDTNVGDKGHSLSGGQRQRVTLARALIRQPQLLILDEATSALDAESEKLILRSLMELQSQMTILLIAHRSTMKSLADNVIILKKGKVAARSD